MDKKGQIGGMVSLVIGLIVAVILMIGVLVPVITTSTNWTVSGTNFTGVNATLVNNLSTFVLLGVLVLIAGIAIYGFSKK